MSMSNDSEQLRDQIATIAQREFENSLTTLGTVAFRDHLGDRIAVEVMRWVVDTALAAAVAAGRRQAADAIRATGAQDVPPGKLVLLEREDAARIAEAAPAEPVEETP